MVRYFLFLTKLRIFQNKRYKISKSVIKYKLREDKMIKPERLRKGDKVAVVSLSSGILGEDWAIHKLDIAKERLEKDFGLQVVVMPNALKGIEFLDEHPELRAKDLMDAFQDKSIKAIFNAVGGGDTIRLLPYINFDIIKNNMLAIIKKAGLLNENNN